MEQAKCGFFWRTSWWHSFAAASTILFVTGLADDRFNLRWSVKLVMQSAAALTMLAHGFSVGQLGGWDLPLLADAAATLLWYLTLTNAFNLIDGLDGLATGLAAIASLGLAGAAVIRGTPGDALFLIALFGACLAFLRFNFNPASIFLGDSGSMFLGFSLAAVALTSVTKTSTIAAVGAPLLAAGIPLFDTVLAVWRRSIRMFTASGTESSGIAKADLDHIHHRLLRAGLTQKRVALWLYGLNAMLVGTGLLSLAFSTKARGIFLIAFVLGTYVGVRHLAGVELWDSGKAIVQGLKRPTRSIIIHALYPAFDFAALALALAAATYAAPSAIPVAYLKKTWLEFIPAWCGLSFILLTASGTYNRVWSRSGITDLLISIAALAASTILASGTCILIFENHAIVSPAFAAVFFSLSTAMICGLRIMPWAARDIMGRLNNPCSSGEKEGVRTLIYGAGAKGMLYLKYRSFFASSSEVCTSITGFIDDDPFLRNRKVHGYKVLGKLNDVPDICRQHNISRIIVTAGLPQQTRARLLGFCGANSIQVSDWSVEEKIASAPLEGSLFPPADIKIAAGSE